MTAEADELERAAESALRPRRLAEFIGQPVVRDQLGLVLHAAVGRGRTPDHVLFAGPPGLGKTTLSMIIAAEVGGSLRLTSGPDRKSTRLNSSHVAISYAVFCLKKKISKHRSILVR